MVEDIFYKQPTQPGVPGPEGGSAPVIPKMIGPYKIEALLEKGGMSLLYLGTHPDTKEPVTIKVLSPKYVAHPEIVQRFLTEAEIIAMADHPNIIKLYGHGEWAGGLYIAMEFIQGISLRQYLLQTPMSLKKALEIILDIAYALCHLHTHGVIHRDLKPENILMTESGMIKVIDFGIAQLLTEKTPVEGVSAQRVIGTPIYMSPEQRENPETVSYPSDIYSLGIISYELVLGKLSHGQIHLSLMPKGLQKILNKALQYKPEDRYQDIVDFITDTTSYLNSSNLQNERKAGGRLGELAENLRSGQALLVPEQPVNWPKMEIGLNNFKGIGVSGIYYDFFKFSERNFGVILAEPTTKNPEGILYISVLRGMIKSLIQLNQEPVELMSLINDLLLKDKMNQFFTLSYALITPEKEEIRYLSCGYGILWFIPSGEGTPQKMTVENIPLGVESPRQFNEISVPWKKGDLFFLTSHSAFAMETEDDKDYFEKLIQQLTAENYSQSPQKNVDAMMRRLKLISPKTIQEQAIAIICVKNTG